MEEKFEPTIVGFLCNWCAYPGADLAGLDRTQYPPNMRIIRVMCSAGVDPAFILKAFKEGADGVFVGGCHPGDCHYISGNYKTHRRIALLREILGQMGLEPERLKLEWISSPEGKRFAKVVKEMVEELKKLGPNRLKKGGKT